LLKKSLQERCKLLVFGLQFGVTVSGKISWSQVELATIRQFNRLSLLCNFPVPFSAVTTTARRHYGGIKHGPVKMNDMPVPEGDFMAQHAKRQQTHNAVLALGICMVGFGLTMVSYSAFLAQLVAQTILFSVPSHRHR
jgi:hypothetical protein